MTRTDKHGLIIVLCLILMCFIYIRFLLSDLTISHFECGLFVLLFVTSIITFVNFGKNLKWIFSSI